MWFFDATLLLCMLFAILRRHITHMRERQFFRCAVTGATGGIVTFGLPGGSDCHTVRSNSILIDVLAQLTNGRVKKPLAYSIYLS